MENGEPVNSEENVENMKKKVEKSVENERETVSEGQEEQESTQDHENDSGRSDDGFKGKYYYLAAEMENMRKRLEREKANVVKFGNERILKDLIDVLDNFDVSIEALKSDEDEKIKTIVSGMGMIQKAFLETLSKHGLKEIDAMGREFDPNFHEALAQQPAEGKKEMEVINVFQRGYELNGRVLRASKVVVAKN